MKFLFLVPTQFSNLIVCRLENLKVTRNVYAEIPLFYWNSNLDLIDARNENLSSYLN